jgi:uncharacterized protein with FMN-binding domain
MKRVILSVVGTIAGVVALLSFKSEAPVATSRDGLPSAALPGHSTGVTSHTSGSNGSASRTTAAPPDPSATTHASSTTQASRPTAASYTGSAEQTRYGIVQVKVTVSDKKITNVAFVQLTAFDGRSAQINSYAAPILLRETLSAQSANINSVSGASYTSQGYLQSLQSALDQAGI